MHQIIRTIALALGLLPAIAAAQVPNFPQTLPANSVVGRLGTGPGPSQAIPFATLSRVTGAVLGTPPTVVGHIARWSNTAGTLLDDFAGTSGGLAYFNSTGGVASSALLAQYGPIVGGGAGATPASVAAGSNNQAFMGNTGAAPGFRALTGADLPNPSASTLGGVRSAAAVTNQWINSISTAGIPALSQPAFSNLSGSLACSQHPALTGEVTTSAGACATTITANAVTNAKLATMAQSTFKGRAAGAGTGDPVDLTATQATAILNVMVGDSGSGGTKGLVPAPVTGDATKFLRGDGTFQTIGGGGDMLSTNNLNDVASKPTSRVNLGVFTRTLATPVTLTTQTAVTFGSIPTGTFKIEMMFAGVSQNGTDVPVVYLGDAGGIENSGYSGATVGTTTGGTTVSNQWSTAANLATSTGAASNFNGKVTMDLLDSSTNTWAISVTNAFGDAQFSMMGAGSKSLSAVLTQVQLNMAGGATQFDAGKVNVSYYHP